MYPEYQLLAATVFFIFLTFFSSLARSKYFSIFSTSLSSTIMLYGIAELIIRHSYCYLSMAIMLEVLAVIKWSVCTVKPERILQESFSMTVSV